jgi:photosystem II stability/assembly factor-like uncharacterized protein
VSVGTGLYRTTDGGDNWEFMGLGDSERIAKIHVNPEDGDVVYVCATGHLWSSNEERGVYKTTDGGENWERIRRHVAVPARSRLLQLGRPRKRTAQEQRRG